MFKQYSDPSLLSQKGHRSKSVSDAFFAFTASRLPHEDLNSILLFEFAIFFFGKPIGAMPLLQEFMKSTCRAVH